MTPPDSPDTDPGVTELARGGGVAAWRQIVDEIEADITAGRAAPGSQLPTEAQLAVRFGVHRHTVRRALGDLAGRGIVRATQGRGTFVEAGPIPYPIGTRTRFSEIVSRAGREPGAALIAAVEGAAGPMVARALGLAEGAPVLRLDTIRSADGTPISMGQSYFPLPRFAGLVAAYRQAGTITKALALCGIDDYRRRDTHISARTASAEEAARLDLVPGRIVLTVDSVNVDREGTPIQFTRAVFAAERAEIVVES